MDVEEVEREVLGRFLRSRSSRASWYDAATERSSGIRTVDAW